MFSWSNNSATSNTTTRPQAAASSGIFPAVRGSIRPPEYSRQQHLESFLEDETLKRSTRKVSTDDSTYDTVFQTVSGATLILRILMPPLVHPNAPIRRPQMTLAGLKARHTWLDDRMQVVGYAPIQSDDAWKTSRLLLGAAVHQVIQQLQVHPPDIIEITDKGLRSIQSKQERNGISTSDSSEQRRRSPLPTVAFSANKASSVSHRKSANSSFTSEAPPDYDSSFSIQTVLDNVQLPRQFDEIELLSLPRVQTLLEDELEFMALCHSLPCIRKTRAKMLERSAFNSATATKHMKEKESLDALVQQVAALRDLLKERLATFQTLEKQQDVLLAPPDESIIIRQLALDKKQALQESEQLAEEWLDQGAEQPLSFVREFVERRKRHHIAAAKMELLQLQQRKC
ncbi:hypothetical protein MPSEU_000376400 [Mayamaea pseudoterrestris]|nr:hypothetical protein MPSEU_000376400 [Mayamaea pseudoterrestris]